MPKHTTQPAAAPAPTPGEGGSYTQQPDGTLTRNAEPAAPEQPTQQPETPAATPTED